MLAVETRDWARNGKRQWRPRAAALVEGLAEGRRRRRWVGRVLGDG